MSSFLSNLDDVDETLEPASSFSRRIRPQGDIGALVLSAGLLGRSEDSSLFLQTAFSRRYPRKNKNKHKKNGCRSSVESKRKDVYSRRRRPESSSPTRRILRDRDTETTDSIGLHRSATVGEISSPKTPSWIVQLSEHDRVVMSPMAVAHSDFVEGDDELSQASAPLRDYLAFNVRGRNRESNLQTGDELDVSHLWDSSSKQRRPSSRIEAKQLAESMQKFRKMHRAATFQEERSFLSVIANEVSRQCSVVCKERGEVISEVWSQADSLLGSLADGLAVCQADNERLLECSKNAELAQTNLHMVADECKAQADILAREASEERHLRKEAERSAALLAVRLEDALQRHRKEIQHVHRELDRLHELKSCAETAVEQAEAKSSLVLSQLAAFQGAGLHTTLLAEGDSPIVAVWCVWDEARRDAEVANALRGMQWLQRTQLASVGDNKLVSFIKFDLVENAKLAKSVFDAIPEWRSAFAQVFPERFLKVSGFNSDVTTLRIRSYFQQFGVVKSVTIESLTPGNIIVEMEQREQALRALLLSHQRRLYDQVVLTVQFVKNQSKLVQDQAQPGDQFLQHKLISNPSRSNHLANDKTRTNNLSVQTNGIAQTDDGVQTDSDAMLWEGVQHALVKLQLIGTNIHDDIMRLSEHIEISPTETNQLDDIRDPAAAASVINVLTQQLQRIQESLQYSKRHEHGSDANLAQQNFRCRIEELERLSNSKNAIITDLITLSGMCGVEERQRYNGENQVVTRRIRELQLVIKDERHVLIDLKRLHERQLQEIRLKDQTALENVDSLKHDHPLLGEGDTHSRKGSELLRRECLQLDHPEAVHTMHQCNQELQIEIGELKKIIGVIQHHSKKQEQTISIQRKEHMEQQHRLKLLERELKIVKEQKAQAKKKKILSINTRKKLGKKDTQQSHQESEAVKGELVKKKDIQPGRQPPVLSAMAMQNLVVESVVDEENHHISMLETPLSGGDRFRSHEIEKSPAAPFVMKVIASIQRKNCRKLQDFACESERKILQEGLEKCADEDKDATMQDSNTGCGAPIQCHRSSSNARTNRRGSQSPGQPNLKKERNMSSSVRYKKISNSKLNDMVLPATSNMETLPAIQLISNQVPGVEMFAGQCTEDFALSPSLIQTEDLAKTEQTRLCKFGESTSKQDRPRFLDMIRGQSVQNNNTMESVGWLLGHIRRIYAKRISSSGISFRDGQGGVPPGRLPFPQFIYSVYMPEEVADSAAAVDSACLSLYTATMSYAPKFVEVETFRKFLEEQHSLAILESFLKALSYVEINCCKLEKAVHQDVQKIPHKMFIRALDDLFPNVSKKFRLSMQEELSLKLKKSSPSITSVQTSEHGHELKSEMYIFLTFLISKESDLEFDFGERCLQLFRLLKIDNNSSASIENDWISAFSCMFPFAQVAEAETFVREATAPPLMPATFIQRCRKLFVLKKDPRVPTFIDSHLDMSGAISRSVADCVRRHWNEFRTDPIGGFLNSIKFLRMQTGTATELLLAELEDLASHLDASLCSLMAAESLFVYKQILDNLNHLLSFQQNRDNAAESASVVDRELMFAERIVKEGFLNASQHSKDSWERILNANTSCKSLSSLLSYGKVLNQRITADEEQGALSERSKHPAHTHSCRSHLSRDVRCSETDEAFRRQQSSITLLERTARHVEPQQSSFGKLFSESSQSSLPAIMTDTDPRSNLVNAFPDWEKIASAELPLTESMKQLGRANVSISPSGLQDGDFLPGISVGMRLKERDSRRTRFPNNAAKPNPLD